MIDIIRLAGTHLISKIAYNIIELIIIIVIIILLIATHNKD